MERKPIIGLGVTLVGVLLFLLAMLAAALLLSKSGSSLAFALCCCATLLIWLPSPFARALETLVEKLGRKDLGP